MSIRQAGLFWALGALLLPFAVQAASAQQATEFTVRIENVSSGSTLKLSNGSTAPAPTSPGVWAVFNGKGNPLFRPGSQAGSDGLEQQAEEGNPERLLESLTSRVGVLAGGAFAIPRGDSEPGPLLPGKVYEFRISAAPGAKLALAMMFAQSNDLFYAPVRGIELFDGRGRPISGDVTRRLTLWDAGTELNEEPGLGPNQAPRQAAPNTGTTEYKPVSRVKDGFRYPRITDVVRVTITPTQVASR